jgi:hypothetical protein
MPSYGDQVNNLGMTTGGSINRFFWPAVAVCGGIIGLGIVSQLSARRVWDDAYMFVRYADNILTYHKAAWNPGGEPAYSYFVQQYDYFSKTELGTGLGVALRRDSKYYPVMHGIIAGGLSP